MSHVLLPGQRLKSAREKAGLSERQVAERLHLSTSYVKALEADDYERLPEAAFVKGYLRNYARLLELPADDIANLYQQINEEEQAQPLPSAEQQAQRSPFQFKPWMLWSAVAALVVITAFVMTGKRGNDVPAAPAPPVETAAAPVDATPDQASDNDVADTSAEAGMDVTEADASATQGAAAQGEPQEAVEEPASSPDHLQVSFSDVCWVKVVDADGIEVYTGQKSAGSKLVVQGAAPFRVTLGNAAAVGSIQMNDQNVAVPASTPGRVVTVHVP